MACGGLDCDDGDPTRAPGAAEVCDVTAHDEDCDPTTFGVRDQDDDGVADARCCNLDAAGTPTCGRDCDDTTSTSHPTAPEVCDGLDQDCDGAIDERVTRTFYPDLDRDGSGDRDATPVEACNPPLDHVEANHADCNDASGSIHPAATELCSPAGIDENCDGATDEGCTCSGSDRPCPGALGACRGGVQACTGMAWGGCSIMPVDEACNSIDDDCDGLTDEDVGVLCWRDADGDGVPLPGSATSVCSPGGGACPSGMTATEATLTVQDCADFDPASSGSSFPCYDDDDDDGYAGVGPASASVCVRPGAACPAGTVPNASPADCDDADPAIAPLATEICNGVDDDCDGGLDECATVLGSRRACTAGVCRHVSCFPTYLGECNGDESDGCETNLRDPANCGTCGNACADPEPCCNGGSCAAPICGLCGGCPGSQRCCVTETGDEYCRVGGCVMP
jgi:hypothetical protein